MLRRHGGGARVRVSRGGGIWRYNGRMNTDATSRMQRIVGPEGMQRLSDTGVMVLGLGGVGSNCVEALARAGVGRFVLVDRDVVEESNINRQAIAFYSTIGQRKVDVMARMVADINPAAQVDVVHALVLEENLDELLAVHARNVQWIVDAIDTISVKLAIAKTVQDGGWAQRGVKLVSAMGGGNKLHPEHLRFADVYDTQNCRLCRIMRKEGRKRGIDRLLVLYSDEEAAPATSTDGAPRSERSGLGTMSYFPPIMGQMLASCIVRDALGIERR